MSHNYAGHMIDLVWAGVQTLADRAPRRSQNQVKIPRRLLGHYTLNTERPDDQTGFGADR